MTNQMKSEPKIAKWYQRLIGFIIDYFFAMLLTIPLANEYRYELEMSFDEALNTLTPLTLLLYLLLFELIFNKTFGKVITCTVVRNKSTFKRVNFGRILLRSICRLIPFDAFSYLSNQPKGWHDSLSGTVVINSEYSAFYERFKSTNKGFIRLSWVLSIAIGIPTLGMGFIVYWVIARLVLWISDGYKEDKIKATNNV